MKFALLGLILASFQGAGAVDKPAVKPSSSLNTQIYESEKEEASFEAPVKILREIQGETEVFFEGQKGFFVLPTSEHQALLVQSQQKHFPVHVTINKSSRQILKVDRGGTPEPQPRGM